jgi:PHP family Zn ribbon phosphoesterase
LRHWYPFHPPESKATLIFFERKSLIRCPEGLKKMTNEDLIDTEVLIRCNNEQCRKQVYETELLENDWKCPYCGKTISKPK